MVFHCARTFALAGCVSLSAISLAAAAGLPPPYKNYAAKFTCGTLKQDADDVIGVYATSINIHNPMAKLQVSFLKKFVVANQEGQGFKEPVLKRDALPPDAADYVDCPLIYKVTGIAAGTHIDGFIVLQVPPVSLPSGAKFQPDLDVVGKYTSRDGSIGLEIVPYSGTLIKQ
ncbi:MAG TPA: hypothetical protein VFG05_05870 [Methylocella sp.]|nr:hypothetical protein [Methylocella sp.]